MELPSMTRWAWGMGLVGVLVLGCCWLVYTQRFWGKYDRFDGSGSDSGDSDSEDEYAADAARRSAAVHVELQNVSVGCRVKRGVDWRKGNQDGGPANQGTVVAFKRADGSTETEGGGGGESTSALLQRLPAASAVVQWDMVPGSGEKPRRLFYAIGHRGEHHLQMARRAAPQRPRFFWREAAAPAMAAAGRGGGGLPRAVLRAAPSVIPATRPLTAHEAHRWRAFGTDNAWGADSELRERKGGKGDAPDHDHRGKKQQQQQWQGGGGGGGAMAVGQRGDPPEKPRRKHSANGGAHAHHGRKASQFQGANPSSRAVAADPARPGGRMVL
jgi:hypothetical protein